MRLGERDGSIARSNEKRRKRQAGKETFEFFGEGKNERGGYDLCVSPTNSRSDPTRLPHGTHGVIAASFAAGNPFRSPISAVESTGEHPGPL